MIKIKETYFQRHKTGNLHFHDVFFLMPIIESKHPMMYVIRFISKILYGINQGLKKMCLISNSLEIKLKARPCPLSNSHRQLNYALNQKVCERVLCVRVLECLLGRERVVLLMRVITHGARERARSRRRHGRAASQADVLGINWRGQHVCNISSSLASKQLSGSHRAAWHSSRLRHRLLFAAAACPRPVSALPLDSAHRLQCRPPSAPDYAHRAHHARTHPRTPAARWVVALKRVRTRRQVSNGGGAAAARPPRRRLLPRRLLSCAGGKLELADEIIFSPVGWALR